MKQLRFTFGIMAALLIASFLILPAQAQDHASHHPAQGQMMKTDSSSGSGMMKMGMMKGKMGMMKDKKMMDGMKRCKAMMSKMMQGGMMSGMMQGGMMGKMMSHQNPMHRYMHLVYHLPDMKESLGLSEQQIARLKQIQSDFEKRKIDWNAAIKKNEIDLKGLLEREAPVADIHKNMKISSDIKLKMGVATYQTARKMLSLLSAEQKTKLKNAGSSGKMGKMGSHK